MPVVHLSGGALHYSEHGQGEPLLLLHANPGDSEDFSAVIPALAEHYRVLAIDWPGYGQSDLPARPGSVDVTFFYAALRDFLTALALPPVLIIGNSIGGYAAARLASEEPERVRGLILVSPGGFTPHNILTRAFCRLQGSRLSLSPSRFASLYLKHHSVTAQAMLQRASGLQATPERITLNRAMWRSFARPESDLRQSARRITAPTLLLFGQYDPAIPAHKDGKAAARSIPAAQMVTLPCGHASFAEIPEQFLAQVQPFLAAIKR